MANLFIFPIGSAYEMDDILGYSPSKWLSLTNFMRSKLSFIFGTGLSNTLLLLMTSRD